MSAERVRISEVFVSVQGEGVRAGTRVPARVAMDQWNVSLKLAHSGVPRGRRRHTPAIARFRALDAWFKFVVGSEADVGEVRAIQRAHRLDRAFQRSRHLAAVAVSA